MTHLASMDTAEGSNLERPASLSSGALHGTAASEHKAPGTTSFASGTPLWLLLISLAVLPFTISNQSLWIDEGDTASYARQPTLHAWLDHLIHDPIPDCQMPLSMFTAWVGAKSIGSAEWQLRVTNLLWSALALTTLFYAGRALATPWLPAVLVTQPYFWFYNNEARPYALEIFCGTLLVLGVAWFWHDRAQGTRWAWAFAGGAVFLGYTTILTPFPLFATTIVCGLAAYGSGWRIQRKAWRPLGMAIALLLPIGAYYLWTVLRGVSFPVLWKADWKGFGYVFYELTGLSGLGPSLLMLREAAQSKALGEFLQHHWSELVFVALTAAAWGLVLFLGIRRMLRTGRWQVFTILLAILLISGGTLTLVGLVMKKMLWARHWAPVFPLYVAAGTLALKEVFSSREAPRSVPRLVAATWIVLIFVSALCFRFCDKHQKDNYREAARLAKEYLALGNPVWWAASWHCAVYYGLPVGPVNGAFNSQGIQCYRIEPQTRPGKQPRPEPIIFLSRPSIYDPSGAIRQFALQHQMTRAEKACRSFSIYLPADLAHSPE